MSTPTLSPSCSLVGGRRITPTTARNAGAEQFTLCGRRDRHMPPPMRDGWFSSECRRYYSPSFGHYRRLETRRYKYRRIVMSLMALSTEMIKAIACCLTVVCRAISLAMAAIYSIIFAAHLQMGDCCVESPTGQRRHDIAWKMHRPSRRRSRAQRKCRRLSRDWRNGLYNHR